MTLPGLALAIALAPVCLTLAIPALAAPKKTPAKSKPSTKKTQRKRPRAKAPAVSAQARQQALAKVHAAIAAATDPVENPAALRPLFERLFLQESGAGQGPVRMIQFGDSHTAADEWTAAMRAAFQARWGDGGQGFSLPGRPFRGYRRVGQRSSMSPHWEALGLLNQSGDGRYGLGGAAIEVHRSGAKIGIESPGQRAEFWYEQRPDGGRIELREGGETVDVMPTHGERGAAYFQFSSHHGAVEAVTLDESPVRAWGWVFENEDGVTYEALGINGAQITIFDGWEETLWTAHLARRDPALVVLAYGTNEASRPDLTYASHKADVLALVERVRRAVPAASILLIGPPDRMHRVRQPGSRRFTWATFARLDDITRAQRDAAFESGCAFWDWRARMGGGGAMRTWLMAGLAQPDHAHLSLAGYQLLGAIFSRDILDQYALFQKSRERPTDPNTHGPASENPPHHPGGRQENDSARRSRQPF